MCTVRTPDPQARIRLAGDRFARTVSAMTSTPNLPLASIELGDIVVLPDGRAMTARSRVTLPRPVGSMAGFVIAGELEVLLSSPASVSEPVGVYTPINYLPAAAQFCRTAVEGAARYWAPHLPALGGAMGEIIYRVIEIRGQVDPAVIVYRGEELTVFIKATIAQPGDLQVMYMPRSDANEVAVTRHSGTVEPAFDPVAPMQRPAVAPQSVPVRRTRRLVRR
jgi:hypothetical protein